MKLICKDYYKFSRNIEVLTLIRDGIRNEHQRYRVVNEKQTPKSVLFRLMKDQDEAIRAVAWLRFH